MRRKLALIALVSAVMAAVVGCGEDAPAVQDASLTPPPTLSADEAERAFVDAFRGEFPQLAEGKTDEAIVATVEGSCSGLAGQDPVALKQMTQAFSNNAVVPDPTQVASIALLAVSTVCASSLADATGSAPEPATS